MKDYAQLVSVPDLEDINSGMTSVSETAMLAKFGIPGLSSPNCGDVTNPALERRIVSKWVGPFRVQGFDTAVEALHQAFIALRADGHEDVFEAIKTAGMLCVRKRRLSDHWSNHSWGFAVDLYCGDAVVPQGTRKCQAGILAFYPYLHAQGFYWGAGFSGKSIDSMHFEFSAEAINQVAF